MMLVFGHPEVEFRYRHTRNGWRFSYSAWRASAGRAAAPAEIVAAPGFAQDRFEKDRRQLISPVR